MVSRGAPPPASQQQQQHPWTTSFLQDPVFGARHDFGVLHHVREAALTWLVYLCRVVQWGSTSDADVCYALSPGLPSAYWSAHDDACRTMMWYALRLRAEVALHVLCTVATCVCVYCVARACWAWVRQTCGTHWAAHAVTAHRGVPCAHSPTYTTDNSPRRSTRRMMLGPLRRRAFADTATPRDDSSTL